MRGKVTLVGAGPGDMGLLTLKGYEAVKNADVVVYDRLVGEDILSLIPEYAERIDAGKESSHHTILQEDMNGILLEKALLGKNVVRLKGGDCFLFGRGAEELELLYQNNIEFEVIPGITSALAAPAYAGISVTHRDYASSVHIITGHRKKNEPLKIDFESCVKCGGTLVFLMGVSSMEYICDGLLENGMDGDTPAAVVEDGCRPSQRKVLATIKTLCEKCKEINIKSPAVIVVGEVCTLSDRFDWFDKLPLKGKKIIVTRPKDRAGRLTGLLKQKGAEVIALPCIETVSLLDESLLYDILDKIKRFRWIVFTSPFGVKCVFERLREKNLDGRIFGDNRIAVIGSATGDELIKYGLYPDLCPDNYNGKALGSLLGKMADEDDRALLLRAKIGAPEVTEELKKAGVAFEDVSVYETKYLKPETTLENADYIAFTSASTVDAFVNVAGSRYCGIKAVCIGEKTRETAAEYGFDTIVSEKATIESLVTCLEEEAAKCRA